MIKIKIRPSRILPLIAVIFTFLGIFMFLSVKTVSAVTACQVDFNNDGIVDSIDLNMIRLQYLTTPSSPNWDPKYDLNNDGIVNLSDTIIASGFLGQTCSSPTPTPSTLPSPTPTPTPTSTPTTINPCQTGEDKNDV